MEMWRVIVPKAIKIIGYWVLRAYSILWGLGFLITALSGVFGVLMGSLIFDVGPIPSISWRLIFMLPFLIYSITVLFPNRWSLEKPIFHLRLVIMVFAILWCVLLIATLIIEGVTSDIIIGAPFLLSITVAPPLTLIMKKRLAEDSKD